MTDIPGLIAIGVAAFAATNIDDIFVLMMFFTSSSLSFPVRQVILGQYIGIGLLVAISALGSFISLAVPTYIIGLLGIVPIAIGVKKLVQIIKKEDTLSTSKHAVQEKNNRNKNKSYLYFLAVAAVTFSNGGDNIGVYTPMFAKYNSVIQITALVAVLIAMTAVWCIAAYYLVNHPLVASRICRTGHVVLPFVLIGLGIYILIESFLLV
ncbi:MAG TPA: cadmium resistance transporter [Nitrososphaeraceae archaeon]|nr:cadmium resistance transporter [Nitrososphaeraceae archaeon]